MNKYNIHNIRKKNLTDKGRYPYYKQSKDFMIRLEIHFSIMKSLPNN